MDNKFNDIFCNPPNTWGLKGEPLLWEDLREYFQTRAFPQNEHAFVKEMYAAFEKLTGWPVETTSFIFISRYNRGGIAGGLIRPMELAERRDSRTDKAFSGTAAGYIIKKQVFTSINS